MIITVLWEDQRGGAGFGPHELLLACVADELGRNVQTLARILRPLPKKGNTKILEALKESFAELRDRGSVCAVIDRDRIRDCWKASPCSDCIGGICARIRADALGDYYLVLLVRNMETLTRASSALLGDAAPTVKPTPSERDAVLRRLAFGDARLRAALRTQVPSFERLVRWAVNEVRKMEMSR